MEQVISTLEMLNYLREQKLISKHQRGFSSRHSTFSNLLELVNDCTLALNSSKGVAIAYMYIHYTKAIDMTTNCH